MTGETKKHDHRRSMWIIGIGDESILWCYQCGAIRKNAAGREFKWRKPTGEGGQNPAMLSSGDAQRK